MVNISKMLPGYNCGRCGYRQCRDYADIAERSGDVSKCPYLEQERFTNARAEIEVYLSTHQVVEETSHEKISSEEISIAGASINARHLLERAEEAKDMLPQCANCGKGTLASLDSTNSNKADFSLGPMPGEPSSREDLHHFDRRMKIESGDILRYRPLGCPVIHFAKVIDYSKGVVTVHLASPHQLLDDSGLQYKDVGVCMVTGFEGSVKWGRVPNVGETIKFLPSHCIMQQVHSGIIVHSEGKRLRVEGIDLKVWR